MQLTLLITSKPTGRLLNDYLQNIILLIMVILTNIIVDILVLLLLEPGCH